MSQAGLSESDEVISHQDERTRGARVSVIVPCRNEVNYIVECVSVLYESLKRFPGSEILIVDGQSTDGTQEQIRALAKVCPGVRQVDNPQRGIPYALNAGLRAASGDVLLRMDAHCRPAPDYIEKCLESLKDPQVSNVGGRWEICPREDSILGQAVAHALSCPFGVGNALYRLKKMTRPEPWLDRPAWDVHVPGFCVRREVMDRLGEFPVALEASEDIDFRKRLMEGGFKTLYRPDLVIRYYARTRLPEFAAHAFRNGKWVLMPLFLGRPGAASLRHFVPGVFVLVQLLLLAAWAAGWPGTGVLWAAVSGTWFAAALGAACLISFRERKGVFLFVLPVVFALLHVAYGTGALAAGAEWMMKGVRNRESSQ